jgi:hypothetical protein
MDYLLKLENLEKWQLVDLDFMFVQELLEVDGEEFSYLLFNI